MAVQNIINKIKMYMFPEALLDEESLKEYTAEDNLKVRDHILLICGLVCIVYPLYYILYDTKIYDTETITFWFWHRTIASVSALFGVLFYLKFKNLLSTFYKLPFLIICTIGILGQAGSSYLSTQTTSFISYIILMVLVYTAKMKPRNSIIFGLIAAIAITIILVSGGRRPETMISNTIVTLIITILMALRNYTSIRQFIKNKKLTNQILENNNYLNTTYNQLIHDVKSPLMALKHISSKENKDGSLLRTATKRVEKIILELEESQIKSKKNYSYSVKNCIENIISESKIKYNTLLNETKINIDIPGDLIGSMRLPITDIEFSRIVSNIINNAFEAKNTKNHTINISARYAVDKFILKISDNGIGLKLKDSSSLFQVGYSTKGNNRGYGLSHAKNIIDQNGGKIEISGASGFEILITLNVDNYKKRAV